METFIKFLQGVYHSFGGITILLLASFLLYVMYQAQHVKRLDWTDLVTAKGNVISLTKFLQLVGGVTGTWMVIYTTLHDKLTYDLLLVYLTYVGAIEGWSKYVRARFGASQDKKDKPVIEKKPLGTK